MRIEHLRRGQQLHDRFPDMEMIVGFECGAVYQADQDGEYYLIVDEGAVAEFLDAEDRRGLAFQQILAFDDPEERERYIVEQGWDKMRRPASAPDRSSR